MTKQVFGRVRGWALLGVLLISSAAQAYIPPPTFTFNRVIIGRDKLKTVTLTQYVGLIRGDQEDLGALQETVTIDLKSKTASSTAGWKADDVASLPGWSLWAAATPEDLAGGLKGMGLELKSATKHLKRCDGRICWVYRSANGQTEVWIEKDSFLPVRIRMGIVGDVAAREVQFLQLKTFAEGFTYPQEILFTKSGAPRLRFKLTDLAVNKPLTTPVATFSMTEKSQEVLQETAGLFR